MERLDHGRDALPESTAMLIADCRALYPGLQTFEMWAKNRGRKGDRTKKWNNVTVSDLVAGRL